MILGIIVGVFIGGCVGVVVMAIVQMAKEDEPVTKNLDMEDVADETKDRDA